MSSNGFRYYYDYLGLDESSYLVHYDFNHSGSFVPSVAPSGARFSGILQNAPSNFWGVSGSGLFTGVSGNQTLIAVQNSTGLNSDSWTQFFIYQRESLKGGLLFNSWTPNSGYAIGVTDANQVYFQYNESGNLQSIELSAQEYASKNLLAVAKNNNVVSFHYYDFLTKTTISDSIVLGQGFSGQFQQAYVGGAMGYLDEYIYVSQALNPTNINILFSGFYSNYTVSSPIISTSGFSGVTGYAYTFTGVTGITGYSYVPTLSGVDAFGDNVYVNTTVALTGYLMTGLLRTDLTGMTYVNITGAPSGSWSYDFNFGSGFLNYNSSYNLATGSGLFESGLAILYNDTNDYLNI